MNVDGSNGYSKTELIARTRHNWSNGSQEKLKKCKWTKGTAVSMSKQVTLTEHNVSMTIKNNFKNNFKKYKIYSSNTILIIFILVGQLWLSMCIMCKGKKASSMENQLPMFLCVRVMHWIDKGVLGRLNTFKQI